MSYYRPKWMAYVGCVVSIVGSFSWPLYGLIYCQLLFVMMQIVDPTYDFTYHRNFWSGMFLLLVFCIGLNSFI